MESKASSLRLIKMKKPARLIDWKEREIYYPYQELGDITTDSTSIKRITKYIIAT